MPPAAQFSHRDHEDLPPLSDEDVSLLHNIVLRAQGQDVFKTRPKKAIFDAYDAIFAEHGLHTNHDRACLRLLFQLLAPNGDPQTTLYEKFVQLLERAGIALDLGDGDISIALSEGPLLQEAQEDTEDGGAVAWQASPPRPARRNSFTSMYDVTAEIERLSKRRPLSRASVSHVYTPKSPFNERLVSERETPTPARRRSDSRQNYSSPRSISLGRNRLSRHTTLPQNLLDSPVRRYNGLELGQNQHQLYSEPEDSESLPDEVAQDLREDGHALPIVPVSQTQLVRDSSAFDEGRIRILAKKYFRKWFIRAHEQMNDFWRLEAEAAQRDRRVLQRQAFDSWLTALRRTQHEERVRQHFNALDRRAADNYDGFLKAKAFRHWYQITLETKANTEAARQKYLYVKYFNAWHRLTVTNELKAERQSLRAPFQLLRKRAVQYYCDEVNALELYYSNLTKLIFWRWVFAYADRKAPRVRDNVLIKRTLLSWNDKLRYRDMQEHEATALCVRNVLRRTVQLWSTQTRIDIAGSQEANAFRTQSLVRRALVRWRLVTQLAPLEKQIIRVVDWRIARSNFYVWLLKTRMIFRADGVNNLRTKQNAFTTWNEHLRRDTVQSRVDNRILAQAMYKWVIAQRAILMVRIRQEREKRTTLSKFLAGIRKHRERLEIQEAQVQSQRFARLARSTLECWRLQMNLDVQRSRMAVEFYTPKILLQDMLSAWRNRHEQNQKLERWAKDASFYFTAMKTLKQWRHSAAEAKKRRTNDAYKTVRRQIKINLARKCLVKWRSRVDEIRAMSDQCEEARQSKDNVLLDRLLFLWRDRNRQRQQTMSTASGRFDDGVVAHTLYAWIDASKRTDNLEIRADQFYHIHLSELCSAKLRRFSMKAFGIKRRQQDADAMRERHWNKHVRNILKHWATQSKSATYQVLVHGSSEPTDAGYGTASQDDGPLISPAGTGIYGPGPTPRAEDWTAFDADLLDNDDWLAPPDEHEHERPQATSTLMLQTPGYLNTPSKRAARAKALAKMSRTPATPLTTPFAARLRVGMMASTSPGSGAAAAVAATSTTRMDTGKVGRSRLGSRVQTAAGEDDEDAGDGDDEGFGYRERQRQGRL